MKTVGTGQVFSSFSSKLRQGFLSMFSHCFFLLSFSFFHHICHCLQSTKQVVIFPFLKVAFETVYLRFGLKPTWQGLCAMLSHSVMSNRDLSPAKTHSAWF